MKLFRFLVLVAALAFASPAWAVLPTFYVDTAGNGGSTVDSGTTNVANSSVPTCQTSNSWTTGGNLGCQGAANSSVGVASATTNSVTLNGQPNFTGMPTDGSQFINLNSATNTNQKIFSITGVGTCNGAETAGTCSLTIVGTPTGTLASTAWVIGGRIIFPDTSAEGGITSGSTIIVNTTQASCGSATTCFTFRNSGDTTNGPIILEGLSGYPTLTNTGAASVVAGNAQSNIQIQGLTITSVSTSAAINMSNSSGFIIRNNKVNCNTSSGICISSGNGVGAFLYNQIETSGGTGAGISHGGYGRIIGNYINVGGDCIVDSSTTLNLVIADNILNGCGGYGIDLTGATATFTSSVNIESNTCYNPTSGCLQVSNKETNVSLRNNIFNLTTGSGTNVTFPSSSMSDTSLLAGGSHDGNDFYVSGGSTNFSNFAASATDITTVPSFTSAGGANFAIPTTSGAYGTGYPLTWLGASTTSYLSMGAAQVQGVAGSGVVAHIICSGM